MKLKAVEKLCKKRGVVYLFDEPAVVEYVEEEEIKSPPRQWMGDGAALYPLDGVPYLDEGGVYAIFDVNDKQRDKLRVSHREYMPGDVCFDDVCPGEVALEIVNLKLSLGGTELILLKDAAGHLMTIDAEYKKPFDNWKDCQLCRRVTPGGTTYVAVMGGYLLRGLIWPYMAVDERAVAVLDEASVVLEFYAGDELCGMAWVTNGCEVVVIIEGGGVWYTQTPAVDTVLITAEFGRRTE